MDIQQSVKTVLNNYANFNDRSGRAEFWWWVLAYFGASLVVTFITGAINLHILSSLFGLALLVPSIAISIRRFHDIGKSGWWALLWLLPFIGWAAAIYFSAQPGQEGANAYGEGPLKPAA
ncbi:MAG: DUF805 domain-containing protein [Pseudomonadota bacterium]